MPADEPKTPHDARVRAIFDAPAYMAEELRAVLPREQIATALWHVWRVGRVAPAALLEFARAHAGPTLENIMKTAAEQLLDQGRAEGEAKGEAKGKAEALLKLVQLKFGAVPDDVAHPIQTASVERLDRWIGRVLSAASCGEILRV